MKYPFEHDFRPFDRDSSLRDYWKKRLWMHHYDQYKGMAMAKLPEDLRTYEHILWATQPQIVLELGGGLDCGSAVWFADRLDALCGGGDVISVEIEERTREHPDDRVTYIHGDLTDEAVAASVAELVGDQPVMVIEDSKHDYDTTLVALRRYQHLVQPGQFFIVEDGIVDEPDLALPAYLEHSGGVQEAVNDFLKEQPRFVQRDFALYGLTMHMGGWLEAMR